MQIKKTWQTMTTTRHCSPTSLQFLLVFIFTLLFLINSSAALSQDWIYTVKAGDTLWNLSQKHLKSIRYWKQLVELNNIEDPHSIPPGTPIRFPIEWLKSGTSVSTLVELTGEATIVQHDGRILKAVKGMLLWDHDTIMTASNCNATLQFGDGSRILIQADSEVEIEELTIYGETGMIDTKVRLKSGRSHNTVRSKTGPGSRFEISTPSAIAAVRGTEYRISTEASGESKTEVLTGEVGVDSAGIATVVPNGFGTISYSDKSPLEPVALLPPPDLSSLPAAVYRVPFALQLIPVKGADQYRLQIGREDSFRTLVFDSTFPTVNMLGPDLPDGPYYLRIHGIDSRGLEGLDSKHHLNIQAHPLPPIQIKPLSEAVIKITTPTFQWGEPQDAAGYRFQLARDNQFRQILNDTTELSKTIFTPQLTIDPGVYFWRVATIDRNGKVGPFSNLQQFRLTPPSPDISDATLDTEEMIFRWREGDPGQTYICQVSSDTEFSEIIVDQETAEPHYTLTNLQAGSYYMRIAIVDTDGFAGAFSPFQKIEVPPPPVHPLALIIPGLIFLIVLL